MMNIKPWSGNIDQPKEPLAGIQLLQSIRGLGLETEQLKSLKAALESEHQIEVMRLADIESEVISTLPPELQAALANAGEDADEKFSLVTQWFKRNGNVLDGMSAGGIPSCIFLSEEKVQGKEPYELSEEIEAAREADDYPKVQQLSEQLSQFQDKRYDISKRSVHILFVYASSDFMMKGPIKCRLIGIDKGNNDALSLSPVIFDQPLTALLWMLKKSILKGTIAPS